MNTDSRKELSKKLILEALQKFTGLFNRAPNDQALALYAEMLSENFEFKQVTWALTQIIKSGSPFFPSCGEIFAQLKVKEPTKEDLAPQVVTEMLQLIRLYGKYDERRMMDAASENARLAFIALGPTDDVRNSENIETTKAQLERLVKSVLASKEYGIKAHQLNAIGIDTKVISINDKKPMRGISFEGMFPTEGA